MASAHPQSLGKYRLTEVLGEGAMGIVYKGIDERIGRTVALKTVRLALLAGADDGGVANRARFRNEAVAAGRLSHPGIVQLYEFDEQDGMAYIAMEFVEGPTLAQRLAQGERFDDAAIDDLMGQLLEALHHAHEQGVWHRDIKPANLILTRNGRLKVADFGIARVDGGGLTQAGKLVGTPVYIAPELLTGGAVDHRVDLYAAGIVMYLLLTGELPFKGSTRDLLYQAVHQMPLLPSRIPAAQRPGRYDTLIATALAKDPARRYGSARLFAEAIRRADTFDQTTELDQPGLAVPDAAAGSDHLPADTTSFIGRQALTSQALRQLAGTRLLTLVGPGGTGKTRLALQVARLAQLSHAEGAWWVDLSALPAGQAIETHVAAALELPEPREGDAAAAVVRALAGRAMLVVLDNCEQVRDPVAALVAPLLQAAPGVRVLATSRQALGVEGETVLQVPAMAVEADDADRAKQVRCEAVQLFAERAMTLRPGFRLDGEHLDAVLQICRRLDGIPLAIELAAARIKVLAPAQIAARLDNAFKLLVGGSPTQMPRQQTLRALVDWSWELLDERERVAFARLSVFRGDFDLEAAEAVLPDDELPADEVLDAISELIERSLVGSVEHGAGMRYRLLQTLRLYAAERLGPGAPLLALQRRHAEHYLQRAAALAPRLGGREQAAAIAALTIDASHFDAALDACISRRWFDIGVPLAAALAPAWLARGVGRDGIARIEALLALDPPESADLARLLQHGGRLAHTLLRRRALANAWYERGLLLARRIGDTRLEAAFLRGLGLVAFHARDLDTAGQHFLRAVDLARAAGDRLGEALALEHDGTVNLARGRYEEARQLMTRALEIYRQLDSLPEQAKCLHSLSLVEYRLGNFDRAESLLKQSIPMQQAIGERRGVTMAHAQIGLKRLDSGDFRGALEPLRSAAASVREVDDIQLQAQVFENLAEAEERCGDHARAIALVQQALGLRRRSENREDIAEAVVTLADVLSERDPEHAARLLGHAAASLQRLGVERTHTQKLDVARIVEAVQRRLGEATYESATAEGAARDLGGLVVQAGLSW